MSGHPQGRRLSRQSFEHFLQPLTGSSSHQVDLGPNIAEINTWSSQACALIPDDTMHTTAWTPPVEDASFGYTDHAARFLPEPMYAQYVSMYGMSKLSNEQDFTVNRRLACSFMDQSEALIPDIGGITFKEQTCKPSCANVSPYAMLPSQKMLDQAHDDFRGFEEMRPLMDTQLPETDDRLASEMCYQQGSCTAYPSPDMLQHALACEDNVCQPSRSDSWSPYNTRNEVQSSQTMDLQNFDIPFATSLQSVGRIVGNNESSVLESQPTASLTTYNETSLDVGNTFNTVEDWQEARQMQQLARPDACSTMRMPIDPQPSRYETEVQILVRADTPVPNPNDDIYPHHSQYSSGLSVPTAGSSSYREPSPGSSPSMKSAASSPCSAASPSVPPDLFCDKSGCHASFSGDYRKGNLARHKRLVHGVLKYPCEGVHCRRSFNRSDARLKHYRSHHPSLAPNPIERRLTQNRARRSVS